jgi:hypothetical protein
MKWSGLRFDDANGSLTNWRIAVNSFRIVRKLLMVAKIAPENVFVREPESPDSMRERAGRPVENTRKHPCGSREGRNRNIVARRPPARSLF